MKKNDLALFGGPKNILTKFPLYKSLGQEESRAAAEVIKSGVLSKYLGEWHQDFYGGPNVLEFESQCASFFG